MKLLALLGLVAGGVATWLLLRGGTSPDCGWRLYVDGEALGV